MALTPKGSPSPLTLPEVCWKGGGRPQLLYLLGKAPATPPDVSPTPLLTDLSHSSVGETNANWQVAWANGQIGLTALSRPSKDKA